VGLALLVTADFHLPLLHHTYPGNQTDAPTFRSLTDAIIARYRELVAGTEHVTLVFDKGNNAEDNLKTVETSPYHFIGSLVPTQHPQLLAVSAKQFQSLEEDGLPAVSAYRTRYEVFGIERTVLVTYNENLFVTQSQTLLREIAKRQRLLRELQAQLQRWQHGTVRGKPPTVAGVQKKVNGYLKARHMKELFTVTVDQTRGLPTVRYRFEHRAWRQLQRTLLGKTLIFTDNDDWSNAQIVRGYRAQHHVEAAFRKMKSPHHIALRADNVRGINEQDVTLAQAVAEYGGAVSRTVGSSPIDGLLQRLSNATLTDYLLIGVGFLLVAYVIGKLLDAA
jgi:transposase